MDDCELSQRLKSLEEKVLNLEKQHLHKDCNYYPKLLDGLCDLAKQHSLSLKELAKLLNNWTSHMN